MSTQPKLTWLATNIYIREVPRLFTLQHFKNGAWNQNLVSHSDKEVLPRQNKFSETSSTTKSPFLWKCIKVLRASDFLINTVLQIENYLKNNSLLHSPMSAADRVQKGLFAGKGRENFMAKPCRVLCNPLCWKERALTIKAHLNFSWVLEVFRILNLSS